MEKVSWEKGKALIDKCLEELFEKKDLTPAEQKSALEGMQLREMICMEIENCKMQEQNGGEMYSGYRAFPRHYSMTAYGMEPERMSGYRGQPRDSMGRYSGEGDSYGESRGMPYADGRRSYGNEQGRSYGEGERNYGNDGYSRHSIGDRAVEKLEHLMDTTRSNYEKEELHKFIRMIKQAADN